LRQTWRDSTRLIVIDEAHNNFLPPRLTARAETDAPFVQFPSAASASAVLRVLDRFRRLSQSGLLTAASSVHSSSSLESAITQRLSSSFALAPVKVA
jgi:hypothetical protein